MAVLTGGCATLGRPSARRWALAWCTACLLVLALTAQASAQGQSTGAAEIPASAATAASQTTQGGGGQDGGAGGTDGAGSAPAVSATVEQCVTAAAQLGRSVTFTAQMETVPGARRMAMQIVVQEHVPGEVGFHTLTAAGLGTWQRSEVGVKIYKYVRQVTDLPAPGAFRALVLYRWLGEKGRIIKREERRTSACRQPNPSEPGAGM